MSTNRTDQIKLLQIGTFLIIIGRVWQHLIWNDKLVYKIYNEGFIIWFMQSFLGQEWQGFLINDSINQDYLISLKIIGMLLLLIAIYVLFLNQFSKKYHYILLLIPLYYLPILLSQLGSNQGLVHAPVELMIQVGTPIILFLVLRNYSSANKYQFLMKFFIAAAFFAHGLFAIYLFPMPDSFITMTRNVMDITTAEAVIFLKVVGWIDIICAVIIFIPSLDILVTCYMIIWGFFTAIARFFGTPYYGDLSYHINRWGPEFLMRACHFILPIVLLISLLNQYNVKLKNNRTD